MDIFMGDKKGLAEGKRESFPNERKRVMLIHALCAVTRRAGRILTREYDNYLKPSALKTTQFSMLANIARNPANTVSELAELLSMDQTTVSRNIRVLEKSGYICFEGEMTDHRIKRIQISVSKMNEARPLWEQAQFEMEKVLSRENI